MNMLDRHGNLVSLDLVNRLDFSRGLLKLFPDELAEKVTHYNNVLYQNLPSCRDKHGDDYVHFMQRKHLLILRKELDKYGNGGYD